MLKIDKSIENCKATFNLIGKLDSITALELEEELKSTLDVITELNFDLKELEYVSSAGLRVFLTTQKRMNNQGTMKLFNVTEYVMEIFDLTGFSDILTIE